MPAEKKNSGIDPLPRYIMPDASVPAYDEILEQLQEYQHSMIGSSYYYIRKENERLFLCRIVPGTGKIFFHEIVSHENFGISDDDLEDAVIKDPGNITINGYHSISDHIESKLRALLDI